MKNIFMHYNIIGLILAKYFREINEEYDVVLPVHTAPTSLSCVYFSLPNRLLEMHIKTSDLANKSQLKHAMSLKKKTIDQILCLRQLFESIMNNLTMYYCYDNLSACMENER